MSNLMGDSQKLSTKWNIPFQSHIPSLQSWLAIFVFNLENKLARGILKTEN